MEQIERNPALLLSICGLFDCFFHIISIRMKQLLLASTLCLSALIASPNKTLSQQNWRTIASMNTPRYNFTMVPLLDGTILAIGGQDINNTSIGSCELFDPSTGQWTYTGSLSQPCGRDRAIVLSNGTVALIGGAINSYVAQTDQVETYDPVAKIWSDGGHLLVARQDGTATYINDSTIIIAGGFTPTGATTECEIYNAITHSSRQIAPMLQNRHDHMAVLLANGNLLVAGGRDGGAGSQYFNECEIYNPINDIWTVIPPMMQARIAGVLAQFPDGSVLAAGGRNTPMTSAPGSELLDTSSLQWTQISPMLQPCCVSGNVMLPDARYLMTGGQISGDWSSDIDNVTTPTCEWYDRPNERWFYAPTLNLSRDKLCAVYLHQTVNNSLPTDLVMVAGGLVGIPIIDSSNQTTTINPFLTNSVEVLDVSNQQMQYYAAHQPGGAGVTTNATASSSHFEILYDGDANPILNYTSTDNGQVTLGIYDLLGNEVVHLNSNVGIGSYQMLMGSQQLNKGVYFVHVTSGSTNEIVKMVIQ